MESTGTVGAFLLLTMAAVSSGRNAREYFQQAGFQHLPSRPEDAVVFFTASAPPLVCEPEMYADWTGGDRLNSDLILEKSYATSYYMCSFEGNATTRTNLQLIQKGLKNVFIPRGEQKMEFSSSNLACTTDSQLPDEYFQLQIQRPYEDVTMKCRNRDLDQRLFLRFPGYPTIICPADSYYNFKLPDIVGDDLNCAFQVDSDLRIYDERAQKRLYQSLIAEFPTRGDGRRPKVVCSSHARSHETTYFKVRLPDDTIHDCRFSG